MDEREKTRDQGHQNTLNRNPIGSNAPSTVRGSTNINLRGSSNEVTLAIRCDDPERLAMWANWVGSQARLIQHVADGLTDEPATISADNSFEKLAQAA